MTPFLKHQIRLCVSSKSVMFLEQSIQNSDNIMMAIPLLLVILRVYIVIIVIITNIYKIALGRILKISA